MKYAQKLEVILLLVIVMAIIGAVAAVSKIGRLSGLLAATHLQVRVAEYNLQLEDRCSDAVVEARALRDQCLDSCHRPTTQEIRLAERSHADHR